MVSGLRHVLTILAVEDLARSSDFYTRALAWTVQVEVPVYVELVGPLGMRLGLYERGSFAKVTGQMPTVAPPSTITATELYFYAEDDFDDALARVRAAGARLLSPVAPRPWGDEAGYFADPDGNVVVIARPLTAAPA